MRSVIAVLVLLAVPSLAAAQRPASGSAGSSWLPPIGLPLPPIGLPLPPIGLSPPAPPTDAVFRPAHKASTPDRAGRRGDRPNERPFLGHTIVVYGSPGYWFDPLSGAPAIVASATETIAVAPTGLLRLELQPSEEVQLFVDGQFVGRMTDLGGELELEAGSRRIEMRAPGYETLVLDARIVPQRTITYRGALEPVAGRPVRDAADRPAPGSQPPLPKQTFYLIPGCYLGNIPPQDVRLPAGCDLSRLVTWTPERRYQ